MSFKIHLDRETLLKPLQMVIGVVERKQTMPILANVLLQIDSEQLAVTGTDSEVELVGFAALTQASNTKTSLTLPGRKLMDICRALPDQAPIELYQQKEKVVLASGRSRFALSTLDAREFPKTDSHQGQLAFTLAQFQLKQLLQRTYFAMAQQDVRYYLNGLLFEVYDQQLRAVATDGHRLALNITALTSAPDYSAGQSKWQVIIPRKGVIELLRLLEDNEQEVGVTLSSHHIQITAESFVFTSKLVEGRFPDYERVIPRKCQHAVLIDRDTLKRSLTRSAILCNEKYRGVRFELQDNLLKISTNNPEQESAEEEINLDYQGAPLDIGFNVGYLLDVLNVIKSEQVKFSFIDANSSALLEEVDGHDHGIFVVMPMRL